MGTVASNITQTVSFCNTTGVIEREHNLYYVPQNRVRGTFYVSHLFSLCTTISDYLRVNISQWKPEDRTLTIKGRIEDFRSPLSPRPLNYAVVKQVIEYDNNTTLTTLMAYFVVGVRQNGIGAVTLDLEPDHFTNVFFLDRDSSITSGDVFNAYLKNAYVERQHYNRTSSNQVVEKVVYKYLFDDYSDDMGVARIKIKLPKFVLGNGYNDFFVHIRSIIVDGVEQQIPTPSETVTDKGTYFDILEEVYVGVLDEVRCQINIEVTARYTVKRFDNENIFVNYEETFRYRRQFRDRKERILYQLTDTEKTLVKNNTQWSSLSSSLKEKILRLSTVICHYVIKNDKLIIPFNTIAGEHYPEIRYPNSNLVRQLNDVFFPHYDIPKEFSNYSEDIAKVFDNVFFRYNNGGSEHDLKTNGGSYILYLQQSYPEYIASCYISKDDVVINNITFENKTINNVSTLCTIVNNVEFEPVNKPSDLTVAIMPLPQMIENALEGSLAYQVVYNNDIASITVYKNGSSWSANYLYLYLVSPIIKQQITVNLSDTQVVSKTQYFEPILSFNPYSFYSVSYLGNIEVPLNKNIYYQEPVISFDYTISITENMKVSIIPKYVIDNKEYNYYTESLTLTLNNELMFASEILNQYLIQNKAQMKNQYAINDTNLAKNIGTSAVGGLSTGFSAGMMTGNPLIGLGAGLIGAGAGAITSAVTWAVQDKEIAMNQQAKLADVGSMPNNLKQTGTDLLTDMSIAEMGLYINHYTIDEVSYNNIAKYLERYGYLVNIYSELHCYDRKGWNYVKLIDFELDKQMSAEQEESIRQIFKNGVTLLHEPSYLHSNTLHNYEVVLDS